MPRLYGPSSAKSESFAVYSVGVPWVREPAAYVIFAFHDSYFLEIPLRKLRKLYLSGIPGEFPPRNNDRSDESRESYPCVKVQRSRWEHSGYVDTQIDSLSRPYVRRMVTVPNPSSLIPVLEFFSATFAVSQITKSILFDIGIH